MAVSDYSTTPDLNTTISGINIAEGCAPSGINNAIRQLMADVKTESEAQSSALASHVSLQATKDGTQDSAIAAAQATADAALPKTGGTVSGSLEVKSLSCMPQNTVTEGGELTLQPSTPSQGTVGLDNKDGGFRVIQYPSADGTQSGTYILEWDTRKSLFKVQGKNIITASGGTIGKLIPSGVDAMSCGSAAARLNILGGTTYSDGGWLSLFGMNFNGTVRDGGFELGVSVAGSPLLHRLQGRSDGLFWDEEPVISLTDSWRETDADGNYTGNWYRKYSDGWIEQGGVGYVYNTVSLHTPFSNTNYTIMLTKKEYGTAAWPVNVEKDSQTTTSFKIDGYDLSAGIPIYWYACGY